MSRQLYFVTKNRKVLKMDREGYIAVVATFFLTICLMWILMSAPDKRILYNDSVSLEYVMNCDIYEKCQWQPMVTCISVDPNACGKTYQCQKIFKNCGDNKGEQVKG